MFLLANDATPLGSIPNSLYFATCSPQQFASGLWVLELGSYFACRASEEAMEESSQEATILPARTEGMSNRTKGLLLLVMFTLVTLIVAFLMGQYAV